MLLMRSVRITHSVHPVLPLTNLYSRTVVMADHGEFNVIKEGQAEIRQPKSVFYNKVQEFNRDLSVLVINTFLKHELWKGAKFANLVEKRGIKVLDALSATGLRCIRYAKELESSHKLMIVGNDILPKAVETIKLNAESNGVADKVTVSNEDAALFMYQNRKFEDRFLVVDVDPYGSPAPFLDGAVQCVADGGMIMVTCTDMAILCGNHGETCYSKYGGMSMRFDACHEMALRIILRSIESCASRYGRYIVPLISMSADFYIRMFVQVFTSQLHAKQSASKSGNVYLCEGCKAVTIQKVGKYKRLSEGKSVKDQYTIGSGPVVNTLCQHCSSRHIIGGPIWTDSIHSPQFLDQIKQVLAENEGKYGTAKRLQGMLQVMSEELHDVPLYQTLDGLSKSVHCPSPTMEAMRSAILNGGFRVSCSHACKNSIKTDAPNDFLWDVMRKWAETHPPRLEKQKDNDPGAVPLSKEKKMVRYQLNPEPNWGPKSRPGNDVPKKIKNQNKRCKLSSSIEENVADMKVVE